jgi:hypothetical protein
MHPGWRSRAPEWLPIAPGIRWLVKPTNGAIDAEVAAEVADIMGALLVGRAGLERVRLPLELFGDLGDADRIAGLGMLIGSILHAEQLVEAWEGMDDAETGEPLPLTPEHLTDALFLGPPEGGPPLFQVFYAWLQRPGVPVAADCRRLAALARWEHGGGLAHCEGCELAGAPCAKGGTDAGDPCPRRVNAPRTPAGRAALAACRLPGVWTRAGMGGAITGLDYAACLAVARADGAALDDGALVRCLKAFERGAIEAAIERSERSK